MKCILIFDCLNDIIYTKYNRTFSKHINKYAESQGLLDVQDGDEQCKIAPNVMMQLFSPIVTSQRIMSSQFGNSYTSCQCQGGLNVVFEEYMGYILLSVGNDTVDLLKRSLSVCVSFVRHLCGADVSMLKANKDSAETLTRLLDTWAWHRDNDQAVLVEAIEQLQVNGEMNGMVLRSLQDSTEKLRLCPDYSRMHAMLLVRNKFLSLYSSRNAQELSAADVLFISLLCVSGGRPDVENEKEDVEKQQDEWYRSPVTSEAGLEEEECPVSRLVLLMGCGATPACVPHALHIHTLAEGVRLVILIETCNATLSSGLHEAFLYLAALQTVQTQRDADTLRPALDNLDVAVRKTCDGLRKARTGPVTDTCHRKLQTRWDFSRAKYREFVKTGDPDSLLRAESSCTPLLDALRELLALACLDASPLLASEEVAVDAARHVASALTNFNDFLQAKALLNLSLGPKASLTISKYLEEFPGMVHFMYVDRSSHRITAPSLDFSSQETQALTKRMIWSMVEFARRHLQQGHLSLMWKDAVFNYSYFLWFEDKAGAPLRPKVFPTNSARALPQPGLLCGVDFYRRLAEVCFPKMPSAKVRCFELFCVHLGLATAGCVLEQTRRLAATIWEVTGQPGVPLDLL